MQPLVTVYAFCSLSGLNAGPVSNSWKFWLQIAEWFNLVLLGHQQVEKEEFRLAETSRFVRITGKRLFMFSFHIAEVVNLLSIVQRGRGQVEIRLCLRGVGKDKIQYGLCFPLGWTGFFQTTSYILSSVSSIGFLSNYIYIIIRVIFQTMLFK